MKQTTSDNSPETNTKPLTVNGYSLSSKSGFTLIELLVVMFIMVTLSTISVANFRQGEKRKRVAIAADTITNSFRTAQNSVLTGKKTNNADPSCRQAVAYFLSMDYPVNSYSLWAFNNCSTYDMLETYSLPPNTRVRANGFTINGTPGGVSLNIIFYAPFGRITGSLDNNPYINFATATITVESMDGSVSKTVTIDGVAGRIGE